MDFKEKAKSMGRLKGAFLLALWATLPFVQAAEISPEDYLRQVRGEHIGIQASYEAQDALSARWDEAALVFRPTVFANAQYIGDQRLTNAPTIQGYETQLRQFQFGISEQFRFGTKATLSYNILNTRIFGANPLTLPRPTFYDMAPKVELSQSLWRNWLGRENLAQEAAQKAQIDAQRLNERYRSEQIMTQAEFAYWRLALATQMVEIQKESLDRANKLSAWNKRRVNSNLADNSELLQADTALKSREIEWQSALIEERRAKKLFNSLRQIDSEEVSEKLAVPDDGRLLRLTPPVRKGPRSDVQAAKYLADAATAQAKLGTERNRPNLEVFAQYSWNGRATEDNDAFRDSLKSDHPYQLVGVRFTSSLDFGTVSDNLNAYRKEEVANKLSYERRQFDEQREWEDSNKLFDEYKQRLDLTVAMEKSQRQKLLHEKDLYQRGRASTFQILQFEQDYANSQLQKVRYQLELLSVYTQLKLFSGDLNEQK